MRVAHRVILIACSASLIGVSPAAACSPQDYMSPEEWQALSPEQRAENSTPHEHEAGPPAAVAPVAPPADPPATHDATPQVEKSPASPARNVTRESNATPVAAARTTVTVEQLTRMAAGSDSSKRAAAQRAERRANQRAAERRQSTRERGDVAAPTAATLSYSQAAGRIPVRADDAPVTAARPGENGRLTALAAMLITLTGLAALIARVSHPKAGAQATSTQFDHTRAIAAVAVDPVEAELQAMIAAQTATRLAEPHGAQEAGTGDESSTATNSA